jgi:hypothetical protein
MVTGLDKAIVAAIMSILALIEIAFGFNVGHDLTEEWLLGLIAILTPILVWLVPNRT